MILIDFFFSCLSGGAESAGGNILLGGQIMGSSYFGILFAIFWGLEVME